jgi:hypothetical protein
MGENLPEELRQYCFVNDRDFKLPYPLPSNGPNVPKVEFNSTLKMAASRLNGFTPIVFLVVSPKVPHAMIYVIHESQLYTIGFGYYGRRDWFSTKLLASRNTKLAHAIGTLKGALYSADFLMPKEDQPSFIAWVGFLDMNTVNRIEYLLNGTSVIIYSGTKDSGVYDVSNKCNLVVPQSYCEGAAFLRYGTNCIEWAQSMLGIKIDCGFLGHPSDCKPITVEEWEDIKANMNNFVNLKEIIGVVQKRLTRANICTRVAKKLGICGGMSRRRRKNKCKKTNKKTKKQNYTK